MTSSLFIKLVEIQKILATRIDLVLIIAISLDQTTTHPAIALVDQLQGFLDSIVQFLFVKLWLVITSSAPGANRAFTRLL